MQQQQAMRGGGMPGGMGMQGGMGMHQPQMGMGMGMQATLCTVTTTLLSLSALLRDDDVTYRVWECRVVGWEWECSHR